MTLSILLLYVAIAAVILTAITAFVLKSKENIIISYLQNFCGALFIFSGWVKAVDPLGTAYKLEQYFAEFEATFEPTWFSFIAPSFPWLSNYAVQFSVFMIIFEIILGIMLILGSRPKLTAWAFFLLVAFFTFLTGFTYLTGYVPNGSNFFEFSSWTSYNANNMRVTDCGCFGDFIKLEPKISFFKDIFLLVPSLIFIFFHKDFHQLFSSRIRTSVIGVSLIGLLLYCMSNYVTDIPHIDFRPFAKGVDVATQKKAQDEALASVQVLGFQLKNKQSGEALDVGYNEYISNLSNYPSDTWEVEDQILGEPSIPITKIGDYDIQDLDGNSVTDDLLYNDETYFMVVCYKLYGTGSTATRVLEDTIFTLDTIYNSAYTNGFAIEKNIEKIEKQTVNYTNYIWKDYYAKRFTEVVNPFVDEAKMDGIKTIAVIGGADKNMVDDFKADVGLDAEYYVADDILLKTIVRSNPGIVLWSNGKILDKWHVKKLPTYNEVKNLHMN